MTDSNSPLGIGIVGAGVIFREHVGGFRRIPGLARVVGVAELDPQKRDAATQGQFIPMATDNFREFLDRTDVDVIDICTPPAFHEEIVVESLKAGKVVICEKPLATHLAAADRIESLAREYPGKLSIVYQLRYSAEMRRLLWLKDQGHFGRLIYGAASRFSPLSATASSDTGWWGNWKTAGGGVVMTQFIHHLDQICCLFGQPIEVSAIMDTVNEPIQSEDSFSATVRFADGAMVNLSATAAAQHFVYRLDVVGTQLSAHLPWDLRAHDTAVANQAASQLAEAIPIPKPPKKSLPARVLRKLGRMAKLVPPPVKGGPGELHGAYFKHVLEAVRAGQPVPIDPVDARTSLELCSGIYASALRREVVSLPLSPEDPVYQGVDADTYRARCRPPSANAPEPTRTV